MNYHDGKTPYTSAQNYQDLDGNMRSFSFVDHDRKTKISLPVKGANPTEELENYRVSLIEKILAIPAVYCPPVFADYQVRGEGVGAITWNEAMLKDKGVPLNQLMDIYTLTSNRQDLHSSNRLT